MILIDTISTSFSGAAMLRTEFLVCSGWVREITTVLLVYHILRIYARGVAPDGAAVRSRLSAVRKSISFVVGRSSFRDWLADASPPIWSQMDTAHPEILDCMTTVCHLA